MNDDELITAVRESFTDVCSATPAARIVKRGRTVRAWRRVPGVASAVGVAAAAAVAVSVTLPASHPAATHPARLAAFTLVSNSDGTSTLTLKPDALLHPGPLKAALAAHHIPAMVTTGSFCYTHPVPVSLDSVLVGPPKPAPGTNVRPNPAAPEPELTINPSALPAGTELSIGYFPAIKTAYLTTIKNSSYICADHGVGPAGRAQWLPSDNTGH